MSKSEWKDLPDWKNEDEYAFLDNAPPEVWAWEFLRRREDYRKDMDDYVKIVKKAKNLLGDKWKDGDLLAYYIPPKTDENETDEHWIKRTALMDGPDPQKLRLNEFMPKKWGLKFMAPYDQCYGKYVNFSDELCKYPKLISDEYDLMPATEMHKVDDDGYDPAVWVVRPDKVVAVFDLTAPLKPQCDKILPILENHLNKMEEKERKKLRATKRRINKKTNEHLTRHLQVIDAKRTSPSISNTDIARGLGYSDDVEYSKADYDNPAFFEQTDHRVPKTASQQGYEWVRQAKLASDSFLSFIL